MEVNDKEEQGKTTVEETVNLKIPKQVLDFAEFYAEIGSMERDALLTKIVIERLREMKEQFITLPYLQIPELW
uniref:Uncharacterized protein n=1 Tax=viral metagenome TaxID=1070528 RepID=A0A6M3M9P1_9ZZZZ